MANPDELAYVSAADLARRIRGKDLSPVEVVDAVIERIEARNPSINALVYLAFDDARRAAREAEHALMSGEALGPLHGVPTAIKDLFDFKPGWVSTFGGERLVGQPKFALNSKYVSSALFAQNVELLSEYLLSAKRR